MLVEKIIQNEKEKKKFLEVIKMRFSSLERLIEQGREEGIQEGIQEGRQEDIQEDIQEGSKDTKFNITKNMLEANISINKIMKITGLSKKEIKEINNTD